MTALALRRVEAFQGELPDMPIEPSWILEGNPRARGTVLVQSTDKLLSGVYGSVLPDDSTGRLVGTNSSMCWRAKSGLLKTAEIRTYCVREISFTFRSD